MVRTSEKNQPSDSGEFHDLPAGLERVAARARREAPPRIYLDPARIRALAQRHKLPVLAMCLSSSLSGLAACVMVFLALHANPQTVSTDQAYVTDQTQMTSPVNSSVAAASRGDLGVISNVPSASESSDNDALFSPLYWELP